MVYMHHLVFVPIIILVYSSTYEREIFVHSLSYAYDKNELNYIKQIIINAN